MKLGSMKVGQKTVFAKKEHAYSQMRDLLSNAADEIQRARMLAENEANQSELGMNPKMVKEFSDDLGKAVNILLKKVARFS